MRDEGFTPSLPRDGCLHENSRRLTTLCTVHTNAILEAFYKDLSKTLQVISYLGVPSDAGLDTYECILSLSLSQS